MDAICEAFLEWSLKYTCWMLLDFLHHWFIPYAACSDRIAADPWAILYNFCPYVLPILATGFAKIIDSLPVHLRGLELVLLHWINCLNYVLDPVAMCTLGTSLPQDESLVGANGVCWLQTSDDSRVFFAGLIQMMPFLLNFVCTPIASYCIYTHRMCTPS